MKKTIISGIIVAILALVVFNYIMPGCLRQQDKKIKNLEKVVSNLTSENTPLAFRISERSDSTITLGIKFFDLKMNEIAQTEQTLPGTELFFDFSSFKVNENYLAFPSKIFTNNLAAANGISLYSYYDDHGFPLIYNKDSLTIDYKSDLTEIFKSVKDTVVLDNSFGNAVHDVEGLKHFETGQVYKILVHTKGGIEIVED